VVVFPVGVLTIKNQTAKVYQLIYV
jgi:hypothetical protein